jgi:RHS repeat-associated protein
VTRVDNSVGPDWSYDYDARGNLDDKYEGNTRTYDYTFDVEGRLTSVRTNNQTTTFAYDADGNRVLTTHNPGPLETRVYTPFPDYEVTDPPTGANVTRTTYRLAGQIVALRKTEGATDALYYPLADHLGNVIALSDLHGNLVSGSDTRYDPFGAFTTAPTTNPGISNHGFTGHRHNNTGTNNLGLIYMNARYYLPEVGRFISADTIVPEPGNPQSHNRYSYVENRALNNTDPTGHCIVAYSGDVRMNSSPFGTSGICPNTEHWITEDIAAGSEYEQMLEDERKQEPQPDAFSVYAQISPSTQGPEANTVSGMEVVYNRHSHDMTVFAVVGAGGGVSVGESVDVMVTEIYNVGSSNLAYSGNAISGTASGAIYIGPAFGASRTAERSRNVPYTISKGIAFGIGGHANVSLIENIPIYSVNMDTGVITFHAGDYLYSPDYPVKNGWITGPYKAIYLFLKGIYEAE